MQKKVDPLKIKALAIDLDGTTLLPDASLGERTVKYLKKLIARGIQVIICTGRAAGASRRYCDAIGTTGPMVFFNGAEIGDVPADISDVKVISSNLMSLDVVNYGIDLARSMDIHFQVFFPTQDRASEALLIDKMRPEAEMYQKHTGIVPLVTDMKTEIALAGLKGVFKAMFICDASLHDNIRQKMLHRFGESIYMVRTFPTFLETMNAGVSKGEGLKTVMECRGLKPQEVIAFGDEDNDLPMFSVAGFSAAPSSAKDTVREAADFIFGSNAEEGIAVFLEDLFG
jgi:Cof subfamily protein (haloacid dehalogenase superfamily)